MDTNVGYISWVIIKEIGSAAIIAFGFWYCLGGWVYSLNYESLIDSMIALNSGIIIALFVALFQGDEKNMQNFKKFKRASKQLYLVFLVNSLITCLASLVVNNVIESYIFKPGDWTLFVTIFGAAIATVLCIVNLWLVYKLLNINYRTKVNDC